jgi:phage shock protein B
MIALLEFVALILFLGVVFVVLVAAFVFKRSGVSRGHDPNEAEETRVIQELYNGMNRMEQRIEALETILLDRENKEGNPK